MLDPARSGDISFCRHFQEEAVFNDSGLFANGFCHLKRVLDFLEETIQNDIPFIGDTRLTIM